MWSPLIWPLHRDEFSDASTDSMQLECLTRFESECRMPSSAQERLNGLWLKAAVASDPAEREPLLFQFRDALHEDLEQLRAEAKNIPKRKRLG
jgi:hypothetical protein